MKNFTAAYEPWPKKVYQQFSYEGQRKLLDSYRFNPLGWRILFSEDRFKVAVEVIGEDVSLWTPLNIALLEYVTPELLLDRQDEVPVEVWLLRLFDGVPSVSGNPSWSHTSLDIAYQLKERLQEEDIRNILPFLTIYEDEQQTFDRDLWGLVFSILDSILNDPDELYRKVLKADPSVEAIRLISTAILSQPLTLEEKYVRFLDLFLSLQEAECVEIIHFLSARGAESLSRKLAMDYLGDHSFNDVRRYRMEKVPVFKQRIYLQRVERYLQLLAIAGNIDDYQAVLKTFESYLFTHGYGTYLNQKFVLNSINLTVDTVLEVVSIEEWALWKNHLIPYYAKNQIGIKDLLRCFYQVLYGEGINESTMVNALVQAGKKADQYCYFLPISEKIQSVIDSEFLKEQIDMLKKTPFCNYGLDANCLLSHSGDPKQRIFWAWLDLLKNGREEDIQSQLLSSYATIEDWCGVIEVAEWIRKDQTLSSDGLLMLGKAYLSIEEYEESVSAARDILAMDTKNPNANFLIGVGYAANGEVEKAVNHLGSAIKYDSLNVKAWIELTRVYTECGRFELAIATLKRGLEILPESDELTVELSRVLRETGEYQEAYLVLVGHEEYLTKSSINFVYFLDLLWEIDELAELQDMAFGPGEDYLDHCTVIYYRAKLFELKGQLSLAIKELEVFLGNNQGSIQAYTLYFRLLTEASGVISIAALDCSEEKITSLIDISQAANTAYPNEPNFGVFLVEVQLQLDQFGEAYDQLQVISSQSDLLSSEMKARVEFDLALSSRYMGEIDLAMATFESLHKIHPEDPNIIIELAETCMFNGLTSQVDFYANKVIQLAPDSMKVVNWFIATMKFLKNEEKVFTKLTELVELYPESLPLKKAYIEMCLEAGHNSQVLKELMSIVQSDIGLSEAERTELVQIALQSDSIEIATRLIDAGGESFRLPMLILIHYLTCLMAEKQFGLALLVINEYCTPSQNSKTIRVLESDCHFYLKQYDIAEKVLLELLNDTKNIQPDTEFNQAPKLFESYPFSIEDVAFLRSPTSIYLRLGLAARYRGNLDDFRSYVEKALAFDMNHPVSQYAFIIAVKLNGDYHETLKLSRLLAHWQQSLLVEDHRNHPFSTTCQNLFAETVLASKKVIGTSQVERIQKLPKKTAKLKYALDKTGLSTCLQGEKGFIWTQQYNDEMLIMEEYSFDEGVNSILGLFSKDDLWFSRETDLSFSLLAAWPTIHQYYEENSSEEYAQQLYCHFIVCLQMLDEFSKEIGVIEHAPSASLDLLSEFDKASVMIEENKNNAKWVEVRQLQQWYLAIQEQTTLMMSVKDLESLTPKLQAYYVFCARRTKTVLPVEQINCMLVNQTVELLTQLALTYHSIGEGLEAWNLIKQAMGHSPNEAVVRYCYAKIAEGLGQREALLEGIHAALEIWPDESSWHRWAANELMAIRRYDEASMHLEYIDRKAVSSESEKIELARAYIHQKAFNKASRLIQKISKSEKNSRTALLLLLAMKKGDVELAQDLFHGLPCENDLARSAYLEMAEKEIENGRADLAMNIAEAAYHYSPMHSETMLVLAKSLIASGHNGDAAKILSQIPHDGNTSVQVTRLELLKELSNEEIFSEEIDAAFASHPEDPDICYLEAKKLVAEGKKEEAFALLAVILQQDNVKAEHHYFAGWLNNEVGNLDKAVNHLNLSLQQNNSNADALLLLANVHVKRREIRKALEFYQKGIQHCEGDYRFYYESGRLLRDMKLYGDAEFMLRKASELVPHRIDIRNQLAGVKALNIVHNAY